MELQYLFKESKIKTFIDVNKDPWFIGKEIADILGYKDTKKAITKNVDEEDRVEFRYVQGGDCESPPCNQNDLRRICINESGLYSLILRSKLKEAKIFKRFVTSEVLPSIRKHGEYKLKEDLKIQKQLSAEFEQKLAIMDSQISEIKEHVSLKEKELEEERTLRLEEFRLRVEKEKELEREVEQKQLLEKHLSRYQKIEKDDIIYVLTNQNDLKNNVFKVGKTTKKNYKNRLSQYNTGSSSENYYVFMNECFDAKLVEKTFSFYLDKYKLKVAYDNKEKTNDEMYKMNIEDLLYVLKMILSNHGEIGDYVNKNHETIFRKSVTVESSVTKVIEWNAIREEKSEDVDQPDDHQVDQTYEIHRTKICDSTVIVKLVKCDDWLFSVVKEDKNRFIGLNQLRRMYKEAFPCDGSLKKKDIETLIISLFKDKNVYLKDRYKYYVDGSRCEKRNVFVGYKLAKQDH